jgi:hypothetical protein
LMPALRSDEVRLGLCHDALSVIASRPLHVVAVDLPSGVSCWRIVC